MSEQPTTSSTSPRVRRRSRRGKGAEDMPEIVGRSPQARELRHTIRLIAPQACSVVILGENGTGKELVAQALHRLGPRSGGPFVAVNCGAIAESVAESELFGHERGAFTGASTMRRGVFEQANGGVVFLDEVADLSPAMQVRLLRVLQERQIVRMGSDRASRPIPVDVRVVAATNKDLQAEVAAERFREDLYWRLADWIIEVPPLRERGRDAELLFRHFLAKDHGVDKRLGLDARELLARQQWPGNVRQLRAVVKRACILTRGRRIGAAHLRFDGSPPAALVEKQSREDLVLGVIDAQGSASRGEVCTPTGLTPSVAGKELTRLVRRGVLVRVGTGRLTRYKRPDGGGDDPAGLLTARQQRIIDYVTENGRITRQEAAELTGVAIRTASRELKTLVETGRLVPDGRTGNAAGYVLL